MNSKEHHNYNISYSSLSITYTYIIKLVEKILPHRRTPKYSYVYYLNNFMALLKEVTSYKALGNHKTTTSKYKFHYETIRKEFDRWTKHNIFELAAKEYIKDIFPNIDNSEIDSDTLTLFMDVVKINNISGSEGIGINSEYTKKNITPLSFICTNNKYPLACMPVNVDIVSTTQNIERKKNCDAKRDKKLQQNLDKIKYNKIKQLDATKKNIEKKLLREEKIKNDTLQQIEQKLISQQKRKEKQKNKKITAKKNNKIKKLTSEQETTIENTYLNEMNESYVLSKQQKEICNVKFVNNVANINKIHVLEIKKITRQFNKKEKNQIKKRQDIQKYEDSINKKICQHELSAVQTTLNNLPINLENIKLINIVGDGSYLTKQCFQLNGIPVHMIAPNKSNQLKNTSVENKQMLKLRYTIENFFASLKQYPRIYSRRERKLKNFMSCVYLALIDYIAKKIKIN